MKTHAAHLIGLASVTAPVAISLPGYYFVWSDDVDGGRLDTNKWRYRTGERLVSFQQTENISVIYGLLRIALTVLGIRASKFP